MPCNGVAVATAQVAQEVEKYLSLVPQATIDQAVKNYLANLGYKADGCYYYTLGYLTVSVRNGRVSVSGGPAGLEAQIVKLLEALAGKVRQQVIIAKLQQAGVKIQSSQAASNGSVVMEVEL